MKTLLFTAVVALLCMVKITLFFNLKFSLFYFIKLYRHYKQAQGQEVQLLQNIILAANPKVVMETVVEL